MPRILLTGFFGIPGPTRAGVQMHHVMRALSRHHEVDVLAVREPEQAHLERMGAARILRVPLPADGLQARLEAFRRALRRQLEGADYDVVHFRDGWSGAVVLELRGQHGYQAVFDATRAPAAEPPLMDLALSAELERSEAHCMAQADHVLVPSALARDHVLRRRSRGVYIVPAGVDVDLFDWDELPPGPPMVLYAGAVEAGRGLRGLLRAMATVAQRSDANLVIAGRSAPDTARSLLDTVAEMGLRDRIELRGEVAHETMPGLIAQATLCVVPSAVELSAQPMAVTPTKILEYMACRRAVVAPRRGSVVAVIEHDVSGMLFQPGDPADMAYKLLALLHDSETRERLAGTGYHLVRENFTASAMRRALRRAYAAMQVGDTRPHHALVDIAADERDGADAHVGMGAGRGDLALAGEAGEPTDIEVTQLPPAAPERAGTGGRDTDPDPGPLAPRAPAVPPPAVAPAPAPAPEPAPEPGPGPGPGPGRGVSHCDTFEMPALQVPAPPVAIARAAAGHDERDYRAVSGEVEVRTPPPGPRDADLDQTLPVRAASVLLGGSKDDRD